MSTQSSALSERLGRLLTLVPHVLRRDGVPIDQLAADLGVTAAQVRADCALLNMVGRPPLTPDRLIDLHVEDDLVWVELDQNLTRPQRLTAAEAWALGVAVALVGPIAGNNAAMDALWWRLVVQLPEAQSLALRRLRDRVVVAQDEGVSTDVAAVLQTGMTACQLVDLDYFSAVSERQKNYRIGPLAFLNHSGAQYVVAQIAGDDVGPTQRLFKLARMARVALTQTTFVPQAVDLQRYRTPSLFTLADGVHGHVVVPAQALDAVHLPPDAADVTWGADGAMHCEVTAPHPLALCRWALALSPQAEVCEPLSARATMRQLCEEAAQVYAQPSQRTTAWPADPATTP